MFAGRLDEVIALENGLFQTKHGQPDSNLHIQPLPEIQMVKYLLKMF